LDSLIGQHCTFQFEVIVVDNDFNGSATSVVALKKELFKSKGIILKYAIEPQQGISMARNRSVMMATSEYVAFIDDDETAEPDWLQSLQDTMKRIGADAVKGPVVPRFPEEFPTYQKKLFTFRYLPTGSRLDEGAMATNNVLVKRSLLTEREGPFDVTFNHTGGEDTDLFCWLSSCGAKFVWCNEALVYEIQPLERSKLKWHLLRAYRGGWLFTLQKIRRYGYLKTLALIIIWVIPAWLKNSVQAIRLGNARTIGLMWLQIVASQCGKIGFFFRIKIEEYKTTTNLRKK
jgi:glycosyltransferase involved in cell wall biosynthesis